MIHTVQQGHILIRWSLGLPGTHVLTYGNLEITHLRLQPHLKWVISKIISSYGRYLEHLLSKCPHVNATKPDWLLVNFDCGNGLVPSGKSHCLSKCWPRSMPPYGIWQLTFTGTFKKILYICQIINSHMWSLLRCDIKCNYRLVSNIRRVL